jgi:hypothetical protein
LANLPGDLQIARWVYNVSGLFKAGLGLWNECTADLLRAESYAEQLGDWRAFVEVAITHGMVNYHKGDLEKSRNIFERLYRAGYLAIARR